MKIEIIYKYKGKQKKLTEDSFQELYYEIAEEIKPFEPTVEEDNFIENMNFFNNILYNKLMKKDLNKGLAYWDSFKERIKEEDYRNFIEKLLGNNQYRINII
mgnify:FL=1